MRAALIDGYGGIDRLRVMDVARPSPGPGEVLVRVRSASLNPVDYKIRHGDLKFVVRLRMPAVLGFDFAGDVVEVGPGVAEPVPGDAVFGKLSRPGSQAEYAIAKASDAVRKPPGLAYEDAAAMPVAGLSALQALRGAMRGRPRARILLNGAGGGVGTYAVQIAHAMGATVTAVASGGKHDLLRDLGADETLDYSIEDFADRAEAFDAILDLVPNRSFPEVRGALAARGVYITTMPGLEALWWSIATRVAPPVFGGRRCDMLFVKSDVSGLNELVGMAMAGQLQSVIGARFSLDEIRDAYEHLEAGHSTGKTILRMS